jgi:hypothetical protein
MNYVVTRGVQLILRTFTRLSSSIYRSSTNLVILLDLTS